MFEALREKGIKVCSIEPGVVDTPMITGEGLDRAKMIQPEDIAHTVAFVAKVPARPACCVRVVCVSAERRTQHAQHTQFPMTACPKEIMISPQKSPRQ